MKLSEKIYLLRNKHHITQEDFADRLEVSRQSVQKWENGSSKPAIDKLIVLSKIFKVSLDILLDDSCDIDIKDGKNSIDKIKLEQTDETEKQSNDYILSNSRKNTVKVFIWIGMIVGCYLVFPIIIGVISLNKLDDSKDKKEIQTWAILTMLFCSLLAGILMLDLWVRKNNNSMKDDKPQTTVSKHEKTLILDYGKAIQLKAQHQYYNAMLLFEKIGDYKDSLLQYEDCKTKYNEQKYRMAIKEGEDGCYLKAVGILSKIKEYKDADALIQKYNLLLKEQEYQKAIKCSKANNYATAMALLRQLGNYKDSIDLIKKYTEIQKSIEIDKTYNKCLNQLNDKELTISDVQKIIDILEKIIDYKDSKALIEKAHIFIEKLKEQQRLLKKKRIKYSSIFGSIAVVLIATFILTIELFIPLSRYNKAIDYINSKQYEEAIEVLDDLDGFYDTRYQLEAIKAYQCFENKNYEGGIDKLYNIGGKVIVNFDANGGSVQTTQKVIKKARHIYESAAFYGYKFYGWELEDYSVSNDKNEYNATINLKARYKPIEYKISYDLNGGTLTNKPDSYTYGEKDVFIEMPTKTGYTFDGWSGTDIDGKTNDLVISKGTIGNKTYKANWVPNEYIITYDVDGGNEPLIDYKIVEFDSQFDLPVPSKNGYEFNGWYYKGTQVESGVYIYPYDLELIAHWVLIDYTITYDLNGGNFKQENPYVYTCESNNINIANPTKTGYTFDGWSGTDIEGKTKDLVINKGTIGNKIYQAHWVPNEYIITYDVNGGDELESTTQKVLFNQAFYLKTPTKTGYIFDGWLYNGKLFNNSSSWELTSNIELVASYSPREDIKYTIGHYKENADDNDYVLYETETLYGEADSNVIAYSKSYFGFVSQNNKTIHINADGSAVLDFYYKRETNDITYYLNNGSFNYTLSYKYEQMVSETASKDDLTFGGWYLDYNLEQKFNGIMPNEDINLYAYWEEETLTNLFDYSINEDGVLIYSYLGTNNNIRIPSYTNDIPVKIIQTDSFRNQSTLEQVFIPETVTSIGSYAFAGCSSIESITIPNSVTSIGSMAFASCSSLKSVAIGPGVTSIGGSAFDACRALESITIPDSVTSIGQDAFYNCSSLKNVTLPTSAIPHIPKNGLKTVIITSGDSIPYEAFRGCSSLTSITIPDSVTSIGQDAFYNCSSLKNATIPASAISYIPKNKLETVVITSGASINTWAFSECTSLISITIPNSITSIGKEAFKGCSSLTNITIPDSITSIGDGTFRGCSSLTSIVIPDSVISIGEEAFKGCSSLTNITIPDGVTSIDRYVFAGCSSLKSVTIGNGVTSIGNHAFSVCDSLTSIVIPDSVTSIGTYAFSSCSSLESITIANSVTRINDSAFFSCQSLKSITIPDGVTWIDYRVFSNCSLLESIIIPETVTFIGGSVFQNCTSFKYIYYTGTKEQWDSINISSSGNQYLENVTIIYNYVEEE